VKHLAKLTNNIMSKIFEFNGNRQGTLIDSVSGIQGTLTPGTGGFKKTEKGMAMLFDGSATKIELGNQKIGNQINGKESASIAIAFKATGEESGVIPGVFGTLIVTGSNGLNVRINKINATTYSIITGGRSISADSYQSHTTTDTYNFGTWQFVVANFNYADDTISIYVNGVLEGTSSVTFGSDTYIQGTSTATDTIGDVNVASPSFSSGYVSLLSVYDEASTQSEINELYKEFQNSYGTTEQKRNFIDVRPTDLSNEEGLVAAYNMIPSKGTLVDISGNGNNGTISGALSTKDGMKFDGVDDSVALGNIDNIKSLSFRIKLATTTEQILEGAANDKLILANAGTLTYTDFDNAYINGVDSNTISAGLWHNVVITSTTDVDMSACTLALNNASYGAFEIEDLKFHSNELTPQQAKDYSNSFAKLTLRDSFSDTGADGIVKTPKGWM